jgi:hypothetical protein
MNTVTKVRNEPNKLKPVQESQVVNHARLSGLPSQPIKG